MLSLDCTNEGRLAKNGNTHRSKIRNWQANVIAFDDTELNEWLMQAIEEGSGQFLPALAEAAVIACAEDYFLVRPVLINLKRKYCVGSPAPGETKQMMSGRAARDSNPQSSAASAGRSRGKSGFREYEERGDHHELAKGETA
jgi:hypothetical protein